MSLNPTSLVAAQSNRKSYRYDIPNSLRFRNDQYSRLTKIFSTVQTDTTKWTVSFWYKNADNDDMNDVYFFQSNSGTDSYFHYLETGVSYGPNTMIHNRYNSWSDWTFGNGNKFRDTNWYHFVYSYDESETNKIDRLKQYINGVRSTITASGYGPSSSYPADWCKQNYYTAIGRAYDGIQNPSHNPYPFRGYMAEFHSFDGVVLEPSEFGRTDKNGNWIPKKVTNTNYGNNGFYLDFSDITDIGADRSGNNNHFTPSGFDTTISTDTVTNIATSTGTDYLSGATLNSTTEANAEYAFDSNLGTPFNGPCAATTGNTQSCNHSSRVTATIEYEVGSEIPVSSSLRVYYRGLIGGTHYGGSLYFKINGTQYGSGSGGPSWVEVPVSTPFNIESIGIDGSNQSDNCCASASLYAIEVDGVILKSNDTEYTLTFNTGTSISSFSRGDIVYQSPSVYGTVLSKDSANNQITLGYVTGTFVTNQTVYKDLSQQDNYFNYDYMKDSPTNNYATWNPLIPHVTTSHGDLNITNQRNCTTTFGKFKTGKYYFEWNATQAGYIGVTDNIDSWGNNTTPFAHSDDSLGYYAANQRLYRNSSTGVVYGPIIQSGTLAMAVDFDNGTIEYFHDGVSLGSATDATSTLTPGKEYYIAGQGLDTTNDLKTNFGQQPFRHTPPAGYYPLARKYLPAQKFINGEDHFKTILSDATTGNYTSGAVTNVTNNGGKNYTNSLGNTFGVDAIALNAGNSNGSDQPYFYGGTCGFLCPNTLTITFSPPLSGTSITLDYWLPHNNSCPKHGGGIETTEHLTITGSSNLSYVDSSSTCDVKTTPSLTSISQISATGQSGRGSAYFGNITVDGNNDNIFIDNLIVLTFANASDVAGFNPGQIVYKQGNTAVRGKIESVNSASSPYTLSIRSNSTWSNGDILQTGSILNEAQTIFPSGLWWIKDRQNANQHQFVDSIRGRATARRCPAANISDYSEPVGNSVAWCWSTPDEFNDTASNINSTGRKNQDAGFSIRKYTGNATTQQSIAHGLGKTPEFIIVCRESTTVVNTSVWHTSMPNVDSRLVLETTAATATYAGVWSQAPDATNIYVGTNNLTNKDITDYTAYIWTSVPGYSAFGSYVGNNSTDGPFIYTGFRPQFFLTKCSSTGGGGYHWLVRDSTINPHNQANKFIGVEGTFTENDFSTVGIDILSNGFKMRTTNYALNSSGLTYIYAAFAEKPSFAKNFSSANPR